MKSGSVLLLVVLAIGFGLAFSLFFMSSLFSESSMYTDFGMATKLNKKVHVVGKWVKRDEYNYNPEKDVLHFWMADSLQNVVQVKYHDPMPPNFESAEKVVVVGKMKDNIFEADEIQMKCPSKYNKNELQSPEGAPAYKE